MDFLWNLTGKQRGKKQTKIIYVIVDKTRLGGYKLDC